MLVQNWISTHARFAKEAGKSAIRTVSVAIFREKDGKLEVLVGKRGRKPESGRLALPGGHVEDGESLSEAAIREISEETGVTLTEDQLNFVERKKRKADDKRIDIVFFAKVPYDTKCKAGSDVDEVVWKSTGDVKGLVFGHGESIQKAVDMMRQKKVASTDGPLPIEKRGILIVFEGVDGSGKSTQSAKLSDWLESQGYAVVTTCWNSSKLLKKPMKKAKEKKILSPLVFSMLSMTDMILRYENVVKPALERNHVVICDRYSYTSLVRDGIRGIDQKMIRNNYEELRQPDIIFHCVLPVEAAVERVTKSKGLKYYSAGMDMGLSPTKEESCLKYTALMDKKYKEILPDEENYVKLDMDRKVDDIFDDVLDKLSNKFKMMWA